MLNESCARIAHFLWLLLLLAGPAATWASGPELRGRALILRLPDVPEPHLDRLSAPVAARDNALDRGVVTASSFIDPLRGQLIPVRQQAVSQDPECCTRSSFSELLDNASREIDFIELDHAAALLARARQVLACGSAVIPPDELGRLLFLEAVLRIEQRQPEGERLRGALAISPSMPFPSAYSDRVRSAYQAARRAGASTRPVSVRIDPGTLEGFMLTIDGQRIQTREVTLPAGPHFLQVITPEGRAVAGMEARLEAGAGPGQVWPPPELRPPGRSELAGRIQLEVSAGRLSAPLAAAARVSFAQGGYAWGGLVAVPTDSRWLHTVWLGPADFVEASSLALRTGTKRSRRGLYGVIGFGAAALIGGGLAGYTYRIGTTAEFPNTVEGHGEAEALIAGNRVGNGVLTLGLTGMLASAGYTWFLPRRSRSLAAAPLEASGKVAIGPGGLRIEW